MAKNYTFAETVEIINKGTDTEAISDIGRRFPILLHKVTRITAKAGEEFVDLMKFMPDYLTANKVNTALKATGESDNSDTEEVEEVEAVEAEVKSTKAKETKAKETAKKPETKETKETTESGSDYESMSGKELWDLLGKAGKRKDCKDKMGGLKKDDMVEYIKKYGLGEVEEEVEETEEAEEATESTNPYDGKSAMDLFKECKKRGIKAEAKKPAKFYVDLLMKDDAKAEESVEEDSDDWDTEEEEAPKAKPEKKASKKVAKKEVEDDDDDWDI